MKNNIVSYAKKYQDNVKKSNSRFKAWDHCYKAFNDVHNSHKNNKEFTEQEIDYLCLNLAMYLANWGMLRNSFLLERDYKVHESAVKEILNADECLWGMKVDEYNQKAIDDLVKKIVKIYKNIKEDVYKNDKNKESNSANLISDTLITKILMGTLGCVPAFDKYFVYAIDKLINAPKNFNKNSMQKLVNFYKENYDEFENVRKTMIIDNSNLEYPQMKLLDMCFWQYGKDHSNKK